MAIMITGGTGFLGSYLARHLIQEKGETGIVLFDMYPNLTRVAQIHDMVTIVQGDVLETHELLSTMKRHQVDRVVHLAFILGGANVNGADVPADKLLRYLKVQCMGTASVFDACRIHGVDRLVYASSVAVHGYTSVRDEEYNEDVVPRPDCLYGACKLWSEHIADVYHRSYGLDVIGMRPTTVFGVGAGQRGSYAAALAVTPERPEFVLLPELAALGKPVVMPPDDLVTDWMYAADAAEAWYLALMVRDPAHRVFNMCSERRRFGDASAHMRRLLPDAQISVSTEPVPLFPLMDNTRLRTELGFGPRYSLEEGLAHYVDLVRRQADLEPVG